MNRNNNINAINYKKCCGVKGLRLNPRRFSVQRLRVNFTFIFRVFRRWRNSYSNCLRLLRRRRNIRTDSVADVSYGYSSSATRMTHSNSFSSEAIADCLEFIKRNSVSVDDEREPMLGQG